jgi:hypothetical protein
MRKGSWRRTKLTFLGSSFFVNLFEYKKREKDMEVLRSACSRPDNKEKEGINLESWN